jgi:hypothetical protein
LPQPCQGEPIVRTGTAAAIAVLLLVIVAAAVFQLTQLR